MRSNERERGLFERDITVELAQVVQSVHGEGLVDLESCQLGDPWVLEGLLSRWAFLRVVGEESADEILAVLRDGLPDAVVEVELSLTDLLHDVLVRLSVEGRHTRKQDIRDDTAGPDIALFVVVLVEDFGGDVVRGAELLVKVSVGVVDERGAEINDLDLIELLVLLEQNVLGLQIAMDDVCLMTVVDAGEDLFHKDGAVTFAEFAALEDLIEELTTLADFSDQIVALLVFEELVHFDDVRVVLYSHEHKIG